jgi:DNA helicase-2/ATP-dependent DNA helicase PcrA
MPDNTSRSFARCHRGLVVAPAGYGKTYLIAKSVGYAPGKQLVLTHTHAGVDALRTKLKDVGVPAGKCRVTTIDSLASFYSNAFPHLAEWNCEYPSSDEEWRALRVAACRLFRCRAPRRVLLATYAGVFVDEYQDCCGTQHAMIGAIAEALPCRIVGDPLQAIYRKLHANDIAKWRDIEKMFPVVDELTVPHRWRERNPQLGDWLADVRSRLVRGIEVDFTNAYGIVKWIPSTDTQHQTAACYKVFDKGGVVAICDWPARCAVIAGKTRNHFAVLESVECPDLLRAADIIGDSRGLTRINAIVDLAQRCFTGMAFLKKLVGRLKKGIAFRPYSPDKIRLWGAMQAALESTDLQYVEAMMSAIEQLSGNHFYIRRELWREMRRTLKTHVSESGKSLRESAWVLRDNARRNGRHVFSKRTVATPLLIKGLEFDHALLLDAMQMGSAEELYVSLTRGACSLTILSSERRVVHSAPAWIRENTARTNTYG